MDEYWNHNVAYHRWILRIASEHEKGDFLDVGCGDGLLLRRLAPHAHAITGIEPDGPTRARALERVRALPHVRPDDADFLSFDPGEARFDLITFVASAHHMPFASAMAKAADLLRPGGDLLVVGLAANRSAIDWTVSALALPAVRFGSWLHRETRDVGVPVSAADQNLRQIREVARTALPASRIRRGLYYRYLLRWTKPD